MLWAIITIMHIKQSYCAHCETIPNQRLSVNPECSLDSDLAYLVLFLRHSLCLIAQKQEMLGREGERRVGKHSGVPLPDCQHTKPHIKTPTLPLPDCQHTKSYIKNTYFLLETWQVHAPESQLSSITEWLSGGTASSLQLCQLLQEQRGKICRVKLAVKKTLNLKSTKIFHQHLVYARKLPAVPTFQFMPRIVGSKLERGRNYITMIQNNELSQHGGEERRECCLSLLMCVH